MKTLRKQVGQLLIVGLESAELTPLEMSWFKIVEPGGVILFRRNVNETAQTYALLAQVNSLSAAPLFRCVDLEGGLVDRLRDVIAPMPSLAAVGASAKPWLYHRHGRLIGNEARSLGFNVVLAPVLDLALPVSQAVMRTRTFFANAVAVTDYADAFLEGLASARILGCGKHFPGLGGGALDSHHATPAINRSWDTLWAEDLLPYRKLKSKLPMVLISHATYPAVEAETPASISRHWITDVLVKRIGFRGLILSDDMEMGGILTQSSIEDAAIAAVAAGTHLVEICKDPALVLRAYEALLCEAERSTAFRSIVEGAFRRIMRAKRTLDVSQTNKPPSPAQISKMRTEVEAFRKRLPTSEVNP